MSKTNIDKKKYILLNLKEFACLIYPTNEIKCFLKKIERYLQYYLIE